MYNPEQARLNRMYAEQWQKQQKCQDCGGEIDLQRILWCVNNQKNYPRTCRKCSDARRFSPKS